METLAALVGANIRRLRREMRPKPSIADIASRFDGSPGYLSRVERGLENPTLDKLESIADALGVKVRDFFEPRPGAPAPTPDLRAALATAKAAIQVAEAAAAPYVVGPKPPSPVRRKKKP